MKYGYMIVSYGDEPDQDYYDDKIFLSRIKAQQECKKMQKDYDDDCENPYEFQVKQIKIIK